MSQRIKIGVLGAFRGMSMIRVLARHPDAQLVAVCDKASTLLEKVKREGDLQGQKIALYQDFDTFMEHPMDAVVLANYANEHAPFAVKAMESGLHVLSEVLPVETLDQAVTLVETVEKTSKIYAYGENYCYFPGTMEMRKLYRQGVLGEFLHGEGEYVHDCQSIWPEITYGEPDHWRNRLYSTYYCTHSLGPLLYITGTRLVRLTGYETPNAPSMAALGFKGGTSAMIVGQTDNGGTVKSLHGYLKREPSAVWYSLYGSKGMIETDRWDGGIERVSLFTEGSERSSTAESYRPKPPVGTALAQATSGHGGSDFYSVHYFIQKILGRPEGMASIDVYTALDMALPGIIAYKSILKNNISLSVPDFRNPHERELYRGDHFCTNPKIAGNQLAPQCSHGVPKISPEVYQQVRRMWEEKERG